jgi:hypothetical protein
LSFECGRNFYLRSAFRPWIKQQSLPTICFRLSDFNAKIKI